MIHYSRRIPPLDFRGKRLKRGAQDVAAACSSRGRMQLERRFEGISLGISRFVFGLDRLVKNVIDEATDGIGRHHRNGRSWERQRSLPLFNRLQSNGSADICVAVSNGEIHKRWVAVELPTARSSCNAFCPPNMASRFN